MSKFIATHGAHTREGFLIGVREPHLVLRHELRGNRDDPSTHSTQSVKGAPPSGDSKDVMLFPVKKRPTSDAVTQSLITLGRAPTNDIVLADYRVSRVQVFFDHDGGWRIGDAGSTNGTKVDGKVVPRDGGRMPLPFRSKITIAGAIELEFVDPDALYDMMVRESLRAKARAHDDRP